MSEPVYSAESVRGICVLCGQPTITQKTVPPEHLAGLWAWEVRHEDTGNLWCDPKHFDG